MNVLAIIPARYASSRFPGKPLVPIGDRPMIRHVYDTVSAIESITRTIVATDDERIEKCIRDSGGEVMMTSCLHQSGTDRCGEVVERLLLEGDQYDWVINIQGDEPFLNRSQIETLLDTFRRSKDLDIVSLKKSIHTTEELFSPNVVKVVTDNMGDALYFSRSPIPYLRGVEKDEWFEKRIYYKHIGIYAYSLLTLQKVVKLKSSDLELAESLEQLRWLENGFHIHLKETQVENIAIDTPEDLLKIKHIRE